MTKIYLCVIFCFIFLSSYSQSTTVKQNRVKIQQLSSMMQKDNVYIIAKDSSTKATLSGASISFTSQKDTAYFITSLTLSPFQYTFKDSVDITVKYVGYNTVREKIKLTPPAQIEILMSVGKMDFGEITVVGKTLAMIINKDTIQYNASAFKAMEGDPMQELFKSLPGVTFIGNELRFRGEKVERIYIDKSRLFSDEVGIALMNITADDVVNVKFYKEEEDWSKLNNIKNASKKMVADVTTKSKPKVIYKISLSGEYGQTIDKNSHQQVDNKYNFGGTGLFTRAGRMLDIKASDNQSEIDRNDNKINGTLLYRREKVNKSRFHTNNSLDITKNEITSYSERSYYPSDFYHSRDDLNKEEGTKRQSTINSETNYSKILADKSEITLRFSFSYNQNKNKSLENRLSIVDNDTINRLNLNKSSKKRDIRYNGTISYRKYIPKPNIFFSAGITVNVEDHPEDLWQVDTLASSSIKLFADDHTNGWSRNYSGNIGLSKSFFNSKLSLSLSDNIGYKDEKSERNAFDILSQKIDSVNSHHYTMNYLLNRASLDIKYKIGAGILIAEVGWDTKQQQRDEFFPKSYDNLRIFNTPSYLLNYSLYSGSFTILSTIKRSSDALPIEDLRREIDDTDPTILRAGNPNLKMPVNNHFSLNCNLSSNFIISANAYIIENYVTTRTQFFKENIYLSDYNYFAKAGTSLYTKENYSSQKRLNFSFSYSARPDFLKSTIRASVRYKYSSTPFILGDVYDKSNLNDLSLDFSLETLFSTKVKFKIFADATKGWRNDMTNNDSYFNYHIRPSVTFQFLKHYRYNTSATYFYNSDPRGGVKYDNVLLNMGVSRKIGKKNPVEIGVKVVDILNQNKSITVTSNDNYIETLHNNMILGRYWSISAKWTL